MKNTDHLMESLCNITANPAQPQNIGGIHKKGIGIGEEAMIQIIAGLCANPAVWDKTPEQVLEKAKQLHQELFKI